MQIELKTVLAALHAIRVADGSGVISITPDPGPASMQTLLSLIGQAGLARRLDGEPYAELTSEGHEMLTLANNPRALRIGTDNFRLTGEGDEVMLRTVLDWMRVAQA